MYLHALLLILPTLTLAMPPPRKSFNHSRWAQILTHDSTATTGVGEVAGRDVTRREVADSDNAIIYDKREVQEATTSETEGSEHLTISKKREVEDVAQSEVEDIDEVNKRDVEDANKGEVEDINDLIEREVEDVTRSEVEDTKDLIEREIEDVTKSEEESDDLTISNKREVDDADTVDWTLWAVESSEGAIKGFRSTLYCLFLVFQ